MNQTQREAFGRYLKTLREAKELSQRASAAEANISAPYLAQLEKGQRNPPSRDVLGRLAEVYQTEEEPLLRAAGYLPEDATRRAVGMLDLPRLDWAFNVVTSDPQFALGTRMSVRTTPPEVKAWAIALYLKTQNVRLLKEEEVQQLKEIIGYDDTINPDSFGTETE